MCVSLGGYRSGEGVVGIIGLGGAVMCKATIELFWSNPNLHERVDNIDDRIAVSHARTAALVGAHVIVILSDGLSTEYVFDEMDVRGYRTSRDVIGGPYELTI